MTADLENIESIGTTWTKDGPIRPHPYDYTIPEAADEKKGSEISAISLAQDDLLLVAVTKKYLKVWWRTTRVSTDWTLLQEILPDSLNQSFSTAAVSQDGQFLIIGYIENKSVLYQRTKRCVDAEQALLFHMIFSADEPNNVLAVAFAPKNRFFLTGCWNGSITMELIPKSPAKDLELNENQEVIVASLARKNSTVEEITAPFTFPNRKHGVTCFAITSKCDKVIAGGWDQMCVIYHIVSEHDKNMAIELKGHKGAIRCVALTADDQFVITGGQDKTCRVWSIEGGCPLMNLIGHNGMINGVAVSPGVTESSLMVIATASADGSCFLWNRDIGQKCREFYSNGSFNMPCVAFSHDNQLLFAGTNDGKVKVWNRFSTQRFVKYEGFHYKPVAHAALSKDGRYVVTSSSDNTCVVIDRHDNSPVSKEGSWRLERGHKYIRLKGHTNNARGVAISPDNKYVATVSWDKTCKIWELPSGKERHSLQSNSVFRFVIFSSDKRYAVLGGGSPENLAVLWEFEKAKETVVLPGMVHPTPFSNYDQGPSDLSNVPYSSERGYRILKAHTGEVTAAAISFTSEDNIQNNENYVGPERMRKTNNMMLVVTGSMDMSIIIWQIKGKGMQSIKIANAHDAPVRAVAMTIDASIIVSGGMDNICKIWDRESRKPLRNLEGHQGPITSLCISYDDQLILSGSYDKTCRVWNRETGKAIGILSNHTGWVNAVAISEDRSCIVTGSEDKTCNCFEDLSFVASSKVSQSTVGDLLKILEAQDDDGSTLSEDEFIKLIYPPNLCEVIPITSFSDHCRTNSILYQVVRKRNANLLKHLLRLNPMAVFVKSQHGKILTQSLLYTAIKHNASKCIPIILEYYLYFLNMPNPSSDEEDIHHIIHRRYFGFDLEKTGTDRHPFQLGETLVHPCEWIDITDLHHLSKERKYTSLYIDFVKALQLLPQHPCVIGDPIKLHNNLIGHPMFKMSSNPLWNIFLRISAAIWEEPMYHIFGSDLRTYDDAWIQYTKPVYDMFPTKESMKRGDPEIMPRIEKAVVVHDEASSGELTKTKSLQMDDMDRQNVSNLYPFIVPIKDIASFSSLMLDDAIEVSKREDRFDIFSSAVLEAVVHHKWSSYVARYFYRDFTLALVLFLGFIINALLFTKWCFNMSDNPHDFYILCVLVAILFPIVIHFAKCEWDQLQIICQRECQHPPRSTVTKRHWFNFVDRFGEKLLGVTLWRALIKEYGTSSWNWLDVMSISTAGTSLCFQIYGMVVYSSSKHRHLMGLDSLFFRYAVVTGTAFPLLSLNMLFYMQANKTSGKLVRMIFKICYDSFSIGVILGVITFGFAASFCVLFGNQYYASSDEVKTAYGHYDKSLLTVFGFIFANYDIPDIDHAASPNLATLLIVIFVTFVSIILLNMLIAIIVSYHFCNDP
jgi:WD40 repeat protein